MYRRGTEEVHNVWPLVDLSRGLDIRLVGSRTNQAKTGTRSVTEDHIDAEGKLRQLYSSASAYCMLVFIRGRL
jgi:hypothetical protein